MECGLKPALRTTRILEGLKDEVSILKSRGLKTGVTSSEDIKIRYDHLGTKQREKILAQKRVHLYAARSSRVLRLVMTAEREGLSSELGYLLGYPECCIQRDQAISKVRMPCFGIAAFKNTKGPIYWQLNFLLRSSRRLPAVHLISHFPCSLNCAKSYAYAQCLLEVIDSEQPDLAQPIRTLLPLPVAIWNDEAMPDDVREENVGFCFVGIAMENSIIYQSAFPLRLRETLAHIPAEQATIFERTPGLLRLKKQDEIIYEEADVKEDDAIIIDFSGELCRGE